jgi:transposase
MTVMIGIGPHKRSHTAVALDEHDTVLDELRIDADARQVTRLLGWAAGWPERIWAIENANGLGWLLSRQLLEAGEQVRDVPASLSAQVRKLSSSGHKTDAHDARSTAIAGRHARRLRTVVPDGTPQVLGLILERRWRIVTTRQRVLIGIHEQLVKLIPGGVARNLSANKTAAALRKIRPTDPVAAMRRTTIVELLAELRSLDRKRKTIDAELTRALNDYGTCLTNIDGIGPVAAATIISIVGDVRRFPNADHFASFTGTAPVAASSGEVVRYRLNLGGQREMNKVLHIAARVQSNMPNSDGRVYIHRKLAEGKPAPRPPARSSATWPTSSTERCRPISRHEKCPGRTARPRRSGRSRQDTEPGNHQVTSPDQSTVTSARRDVTRHRATDRCARTSPPPGA